MARRRSLRPEEQELWAAVARSTHAMHARARPKDVPSATETAPVPDPNPLPPEPLPRFRLGEKAGAARPHDLAPAPGASLKAQPLQMDAKSFARMTRGKLAPEARIDLHGMTLAEAHPELIRFILNAQSAGMRLVLVITGKGKQREDHGPIPQRMGALRHQVPHWLRMAPMAQAILQVSEAHLRHGGGGAYYVYLRRFR